MAFQSFERPENRGRPLGDVPALIIVIRIPHSPRLTIADWPSPTVGIKPVGFAVHKAAYVL